MKRDFYVNEKKRNNLIKKKKKEMTGGYKLLMLFSHFFILLSFIVFAWCIYLQVLNGSTLLLAIILLAVAVIISAVCYGISFIIKRIAEKKYLELWTNNVLEEIHLLKDGFEHGCFDKYYSKTYTTLTMKYSDILRIEYDLKDECIKLFGTYVVKEWNSHGRERLIGSHQCGQKGSDKTWFTIVNYFDDFEDFVNTLINETGIEIERVPMH